MRVSRKYFPAAPLGAPLSASVVTGAQAEGLSSATPRYQPGTVQAPADSLGVSEQTAVRRLGQRAGRQNRLAGPGTSGIAVSGASFDAPGTLTVHVGDAASAPTA